MSGPPFWRTFEPRSLPRDTLETMLGWDPEKSQNDHFFGTLFLDHFWTNLNVFLWRFFVMFSKPHFCQLSRLRGTHLHQFEAHLGTKLMIFPINVEKWQLHFRSRGDIKIKLSRVCVSRKFIIFWYVFSKPVIATLDRRHYSHYPQFMDPLGIPFETQICNILHFIFRMIFSSQVDFQSEISLRHLRHKGGKGGTGRHLGGIWEASGTPGGHGAPGGSESQKSMPLSAKMQKFHLFVNFTRRFWRSAHQVV